MSVIHGTRRSSTLCPCRAGLAPAYGEPMTAAATSPSADPVSHRGFMTFVRQIGRPEGAPDSSHFEFVTAPLPRPADGQALVQNLYLSVDPYMREFMEWGGWEEGAGLEGRTLGQVMESREPS